MPVRFVRTKKRTVMDIFNGAISPRIKAELNTLGNNIILDARKNHEFKNRTGALEASMQWTPPERKAGLWRMVVFAGGWSKVKYVFDFARRQATKVKRRNWRYRKGGRYNPRRGEDLYVNYAQYVERRGYSVLINAVEKYRRMATAILGRALKLRGL